uniref:Uncharacterized protein LOC111106658 n=1 Tax=Crassostrea virginica TaxID=6565 RepID=A0A8B8B266_CRAVI|nr:uncharacterized protein LOC111106658 [Crassostrea virginica]
MVQPDNKTVNGWIIDNLCQDNTVFWLYSSGCVFCGLLIGLLIMCAICRRKAKRLSSNCELRSSRGTFYFDDHLDLARKPSHTANSNFYIHDINAESSTNSQTNNENRERSRSVRPSKPPPPLSETDESEDELAEGDDYIKMMQPKGSVQRARENSKKGTSVVQFENSAMYLAMS